MKQSAAGVCLREHDGRLEILMVKSSQGRWIFPKGKIEDDETAFEAAIRETREEAGWIGARGSVSPLGEIIKEDEVIKAFWIGSLRHQGFGEAEREPSWFLLSHARLLIRQQHESEIASAMSRIIDEALYRLGLSPPHRTSP